MVDADLIPQKIGLFGGTFDPPHRGHVVIARAAADAAGLEKVLWAPVGRQPLKAEQPVASFDERVAMVRLACAEDARFAVSELDGPRADGGLNYTVDLLKRLQAEFAGAELWCVIGADSARDLPRWKSPEELVELARWVVISRPDIRASELTEALRFFPAGRVLVIPDVLEDVSATAVRARLHQHEDVAGDELPSVLAYIKEHGLYE